MTTTTIHAAMTVTPQGKKFNHVMTDQDGHVFSQAKTRAFAASVLLTWAADGNARGTCGGWKRFFFGEVAKIGTGDMKATLEALAKYGATDVHIEIFTA